MPEGRVVLRTERYGFIEYDEGREVYFGCAHGEAAGINLGDRVWFAVRQFGEGKPFAVGVRRLDE